MRPLAGVFMNIEDLTFAMEDRLDAFSSSGDPALLQEPEAQQLADRLYYAVDWLSFLSEGAQSARAFNVAMLLATFHWHRYQHSEAREDAKRSAFLYRVVSQVAPQHVPEVLLDLYVEAGYRVGSLSSTELAVYTQRGINRLKEAETKGDPQLLDDAVEWCLLAARANPRKDVLWAESLITLGNALTRRYEFTGNSNSLDRAHVAIVKAAEAIPEDDPCRLKLQSAFGHTAIRIFQRTGDLEMLDLAIRALREAAYKAPAYEPHRGAFLTNLSTALSHQYHHIGRLESANEALEARTEAVRITPRDHPDLPSRMINLASALESHPGDLPSEDDRHDTAVTLLRDALSLTPEGHPERAGCLSLLSGTLRARFTRTGDPRDLTDSVKNGRLAIEGVAASHYQRPDLLSDFARSLTAYADHFSAPDALTEAVEALQEADTLLPEEHPDRSQNLTALGLALRKRFTSHGDTADRDRAAEALRKASAVPSAPARVRARAAAAAGDLSADAQDFVSATESFALALEQLELTAWRGLEREDRERLIAQFPDLVTRASASAVRAGQPKRAVELLEQGRGILIAQVLETRTDHRALLAQVPELADRLSQVLDELDRLPDRPAGTNTFGVQDRRRVNEQRAALARQREELLAEIRALPGLARFLRAPSFDTLRAAAARGPIVLLSASRYGSSALLLTEAGVRVVPLAVDDGQLAERVTDFTHAIGPEESPLKARMTVVETLSWLWETVAEPVLAALQYTGPIGPGEHRPHLWWCPTGLFTSLPVHAAGRHLPPGGGATVLDRAISSYTPTLRALLHAREHHLHPTGPLGGGLIVSMPSTPGCADLPAAGQEARALRQRHMDSAFLTGPAATAPAVLDALTRCSWAHFACHGAQDLAQPSRGSLILHDGPLMLRDIVKLRLPHAEFAFLSACETSRGGIVLADEAISFATTLQLAGFRDVIGTLWSIDDTLAPEVAGLLYENLSDRTSRDPAVALHAALRAVRARRPLAVMNWAAYVHVGS
ncbi:CHAT domain-containing protein [Streptomyces sp. NPDC091259]|uniref:CHAT domain-containing protein n=1 Tax=Streptomyces sp. NPDC091259 TaxID=3365976 RepID=UPI0037FE5F0D